MRKTVMAALVAFGTVGLAGAAFAQSNTGAQTPAATQSPAAGQGMSNGAATQAQAGDPNMQMRLTQALLSSMGLYKGAVDGVDGQETRQAIEAFQAKQNLPKSGKLDPATLAAVSQQVQTALGGSGDMQSGRAASEPQGGGSDMNKGGAMNTTKDMNKTGAEPAK